MRLVVAESDSDSEPPEARTALTRKRPRLSKFKFRVAAQT